MEKEILIKGAREHNLKDISLNIPRDKLVVITGLSGSGKSSLAFDTIYAEGQRRYLESLSAYARQFMEQMRKPDLDMIDGLSPAISIEQKNISTNPRSTVGTVTEIYDYLRLLYARLGEPHCPKCGKQIQNQTVQQIVDQVLLYPAGTKFAILAPIARGKKGEFHNELQAMKKRGFIRAKIDGVTTDLSTSAPIRLKKNFKHDVSIYIDRLILRSGVESRLADALEIAIEIAGGMAEVEFINNNETVYYSTKFACVDCGTSFAELEPRSFSFNSPHGACDECDGIGNIEKFDAKLVVPDPKKSLLTGAIGPWSKKSADWIQRVVNAIKDKYPFDPKAPFHTLPEKVRTILLHGSGKEEFAFRIKGQKEPILQAFEGVLPWLDRQWDEAEEEYEYWSLEPYLSAQTCPKCHGKRLKDEMLSVYVGGRSIADCCALSIDETTAFLKKLTFKATQEPIAEPILREILSRLDFLDKVGLVYLSLNRSAASLSGGEAQRIRLATQIGSNLVGVLYILDEPSIGLHQRDNENLIATLEKLRDQGNSVIVVEHDEETIRRADLVVDLGPGAGKHGGQLTFIGPPKKLAKEATSLTGEYLSGKREIPVPKVRRQPKEKNQIIRLKGANLHNLKEIDVELPLGTFICVTGVSGSGKSTLVIDTLLPTLREKLNHPDMTTSDLDTHLKSIEGLSHLDKVIHVDQKPIGRTPRSNPATYTGLFTPIRHLYAELPEAKVRGYKLSRFSFNVAGGRCEACRGDGTIKISMNFLPDVYVDCEVCQGQRYNRETLQVTYKGKSIADVLKMTIEEARHFFDKIPTLNTRLQTLLDVGLGYIQLGQNAVTLSGGEAQRIKLARELTKRATGKTLYILDEPTTGLHFEDIKRLLQILHLLVDQGNTVLVIEHNMDVIKQADHLLDLGPEGGSGGGQVVYQGTPEGLPKKSLSHTARYLAPVLKQKR